MEWANLIERAVAAHHLACSWLQMASGTESSTYTTPVQAIEHKSQSPATRSGHMSLCLRYAGAALPEYSIAQRDLSLPFCVEGTSGLGDSD